MGRKRKPIDWDIPVDVEQPKLNRIFKFYHFLKVTSRKCQIVCLYGGAGSGKSESICQELIDRLFTEDSIYILVVRKSGPSLTSSTYEMMLKIIRQCGYIEGIDYIHNKTERVIRAGTNVMWFKALDDPEKIKSLNLNYVYLEEATETTWADFAQLTLRTRNTNKSGKPNQVIISFNPTNPYHWSKKEIVDKADIYEKSDYTKVDASGAYSIITKYNTYNYYIAVQHSKSLDNPFVEYGKTIEHYKENDDALYQMYGEGEFVQLSNLIYNRYDVVKSTPTVPPTAMGLDFGYHRTALVAVWHDGQSYELTLKTVMYDEKVTTKEIITVLSELPETWRSIKIYADSARPDQIEELQNAGYPVEAAKKDVKAGIDMVKRFYLHIVEESEGMLRELATYKWREKNGEVLDEPIKINDHACDGARYCVFSSEIADFVSQETFNDGTIDHMKGYAKAIPGFENNSSYWSEMAGHHFTLS